MILFYDDDVIIVWQVSVKIDSLSRPICCPNLLIATLVDIGVILILSAEVYRKFMYQSSERAIGVSDLVSRAHHELTSVHIWWA